MLDAAEVGRPSPRWTVVSPRARPPLTRPGVPSRCRLMNDELFSVAGRVVQATGAGRGIGHGIGRAIAEGFARRGAATEDGFPGPPRSVRALQTGRDG